jgi:endo-1,4-beta-D-glucanase Y
MKTMKLALVLAFVSFVAITFADNGTKRQAVTTKMSIEKAMCIKSLKIEILQQVNRSLISEEKPGLYLARVRYRNNSYIIFGKYKEWKACFDSSHWKVIGFNVGARPDFAN